MVNSLLSSPKRLAKFRPSFLLLPILLLVTSCAATSPDVKVVQPSCPKVEVPPLLLQPVEQTNYQDEFKSILNDLQTLQHQLMQPQPATSPATSSQPKSSGSTP